MPIVYYDRFGNLFKDYRTPRRYTPEDFPVGFRIRFHRFGFAGFPCLAGMQMKIGLDLSEDIGTVEGVELRDPERGGFDSVSVKSETDGRVCHFYINGASRPPDHLGEYFPLPPPTNL